jgi:hypothetical protein
VTAAAENGVTIEYEKARERIYGMPYDAWKAQFQREASAEQRAQFDQSNREK